MNRLGPFFENTIVVGDCLDVMARMPDGCADLVVTDPPYGLGIARAGSLSIKGSSDVRHDFTPDEWDICPADDVWPEILRVSKAQIVWGGQYFADKLPSHQCWLVWYKKDGLPARTFADCELAWTSFDKPARVLNLRQHGFIRDSKDDRWRHPTQKPEVLIRWCVENYSVPGDLIFDPFMGSGTTAVVADRLGRKFFGCDISEEYVEMALERLEKDRAGRQLPLMDF